ncbi:hypothetical protein PHLCEN_2v10510 [Hermanssonia centrifuga]|uniref:Major facilitator superfamily (MFS) profile domain-containing protein n=1 Tax=Hermanssonia centrifuga TaxID=98765 RepID=A0A2R6NMH8_9APHY|nr:hypothetical protein PHLCEN_2v10510 [Hermanssonia centrifuga]
MSSHTSETSLPENLSEKTDVARDPEHGLSRDDASAKKEVDDTLPDPFAVTTLSPEENPKNLSGLRKWAIVITICSGALCATCASSMAAFAEAGVSHDLHVGKEVSILGITLFVLGLGLGPLLVGPLSEVHGRNIIYRTSYGLFFAFSWAVAFPPHIAVYLIFRFLTGFCSAAFLSVAGGSVSDLYENDKLATPMAVFTISPFIGPVIGPVAAGYVFSHYSLREKLTRYLSL